MSDPVNTRWFRGVYSAMQDMEEIGGPAPEDYLPIMQAIRDEAQRRLDNCTFLTGMRLSEVQRQMVKDYISGHTGYGDTEVGCWVDRAFKVYTHPYLFIHWAREDGAGLSIFEVISHPLYEQRVELVWELPGSNPVSRHEEIKCSEKGDVSR